MDEKTEVKNRSVAASEIVNSIITTGNDSPVFVGRYERLRDAIIPPDEVFRRVRIESFIGRRWLMEQIDTILRNNSSGYLVLEAHAGLGKTAFLAWLVKERNYIHHFVELAPGPEGIERGLKNLAAQLIVAYELNADEAIPDSATRPDYLYRLLSEAVKKRRPDEKIVIVVDALDEAGTPHNQNALGLPKLLPDNVFFIVSMRPVQVSLYSDKSRTLRWPLKILAESDENLKDLRSFLKASAVLPKVAKVLVESKYTVEDFIDTLMKKSRGLWIYLHFVIPEIERGERSPLDLNTLPEGLSDYYASYWSQWRRDQKWYDLYLPILTALAAAQESSTLDRILDWAGIGVQAGKRSRLRSILKEQWRPFLAVSGEGKQEKYRFYHSTVREFFEGKVEQNGLLLPEIDLMNELSEATMEMHRMIAEHYLVAWGGLDKKLPDLKNKDDEDDDYGLRHLAAHLEASGQREKLHFLLNLETAQRRNLWYETKKTRGDMTGYINDVMRAWRFAEYCYNPEDNKKTGRFIGLQNRYALIFGSINSLSDRIPSRLLTALVENSIWSKEEGLAHVRHVPDLERRAIILTELSSLLEEPKLLNEAWTVARKIEPYWYRANALTDIIPRIQDAKQALEVTREIENEWFRAIALTEIALRLDGDQKRDVLEEALVTARGIIWDDEKHASALKKISLILQNIQEALVVAREIENERFRAIALAEIALRLDGNQKRDMLKEALVTAREIEEGQERSYALAEIALRLDGDQKRDVLKEALVTAREIEEGQERSYALAEIALRLEDVQEALAIAREIEEDWERDDTLAKIAAKLQDAQLALVVARGIKNEGHRAVALTEIALRLDGDQKRDVLEEALDLDQEIEDEWNRDNALAEIVPELQDAQEALDAARKIMNKKLHASTLTKIAPRLDDAQKKDVLEEAMTAAREIEEDWERANTLAKIVPELQDAQEALDAAREIDEDWVRAVVLAKIISKLQEVQKRDVLEEAVCLALGIHNELNHIPHYPALTDIALRLDDAQEALVVAREIMDKKLRASALTEIALRLGEAQKRDVLQEALTAAREIWDWERPNALVEIALRFDDAQKKDVLEEALDAAREIMDKKLRASALKEIALRLGEAQKRDVLQEALTSAREIWDWQRPNALVEIALRLDDAQKKDVLEEALIAAREIEEDRGRDYALAKIVPELQDAQEALDAAREIIEKEARAKALAKIAPKLLEGQQRDVLDEAMAVAREIENDRERASALKEVIMYLKDQQTRDVFSLWKTTIYSLSERRRYAMLSDLSTLTPLVAKLGGDDALLETARAIKDVGIWWP